MSTSMGTAEERVRELERENTLLKRKLRRAERNLKRNEDITGKNQRMLETIIADLEQAQEDLRRSNEQLESRVRIRTEELREARDAAISASRAKSIFLANMSHELRTPLNAIIGYSELIQEDLEFQFDTTDDMPIAVADLQKIRTAGRHLLSLINNILNLSKIEAGRMEVDPSRFAVQTVIDEASQTVDHQVRSNGNRLVIDIAEGIGEMVSDHTKLRQCLINLLNNAAKFTDGGEIHLRAHREPRFDEEWIIFEIEDTGIGIPQEKQEMLFEVFTQADSSTTRRYGGTGLGLTITRHFCEHLGGSIDLESEEGVGTTFVIELPATYRDNEDVFSEGLSSHEEFSSVELAGPTQTVLLVDDDETIHDLLGRYLQETNFKVVGLRDGSAVVEKARAVLPDVIMLDVMMPGKDGWDVLAELKADPEVGSVPVVMHTIISERTRGLNLGAAEYVTKPVHRDDILRVLKRYGRQHSDLAIMVVEDDEATREVVSRVIESQGWTPVPVANGVDALKKLDTLRPDLILLDLMMPEMDGFEFAERVGANEALRDIPVVVLTAADLSAEQRRELNSRVSSVVLKDVDHRERIIREIRRTIERLN